MGKYQLDYKGMKQVERFHEKHSTGASSKQDKLASLRQAYLNKNKQK